jgi:SAM-dependent methyltransferase
MINLANKKLYAIYAAIILVVLIITGVIVNQISSAKAAKQAAVQKCTALLSLNNLKLNNVKSTLKYHPLTTPTSWNHYFNETRDANEPYETLVLAVKNYQENNNKPGFAVDLGAGTGRDTLYLLKNGWHVMAVDFAKKGLSILHKRVEDKYANNLQIRVDDITTMQYPDNIDLINASYTLPYIPPENFLKTWQAITQHLRSGGIFAGHFFGPKDDSAKSPTITIVTRDQLNCLLSDYKIIYLNEDESDETTVAGRKKHWDSWEVVAVKK